MNGASPRSEQDPEPGDNEKSIRVFLGMLGRLQSVRQMFFVVGKRQQGVGNSLSTRSNAFLEVKGGKAKGKSRSTAR